VRCLPCSKSVANPVEKETRFPCGVIQSPIVWYKTILWDPTTFPLINSRFFEDEETERLLTLKNAPGQRVSGSTWFTTLSEHERLLTSSSWFQASHFEYTKGTGDFNKFRKGIRDGYLKVSCRMGEVAPGIWLPNFTKIKHKSYLKCYSNLN
jgi:hypothetical protein